MDIVLGKIGGEATKSTYNTETKEFSLLNKGSVSLSQVIDKYGQIKSFPKGAIKRLYEINNVAQNLFGFIKGTTGLPEELFPPDNIDKIFDAVDVKFYNILKEKGLEEYFIGSELVVEKVLGDPTIDFHIIDEKNGTTYRVFKREEDKELRLALVQFFMPKEVEKELEQGKILPPPTNNIKNDHAEDTRNIRETEQRIKLPVKKR